MSAERDPVMPVTRYCDILWQWLDLIEDNKAFTKIAEVAPDIRLAIKKSNYLWRRIYGQQPHRTEKCPKHQGRWSGYGTCDYGCTDGNDITGWLPAQSGRTKSGEEGS